jgi:hypothetical protein
MKTVHHTASGAVVYWSTGPSQRDLLRAALERLGLGEHTPSPRTDAAALKIALKEYAAGVKCKTKDRIVQPHAQQAKHGFEVVEVELGESRNEYTIDFSAKVTDGGRVEVTNGLGPRQALQDAFDTHKSTLAATAVSKALVDILSELGGTALREAGGVYWLPEDAIGKWQDVAAAVEACATEKPTSIYLLRTVMDEQAVRAVRDAIVAEVTGAAAAIAEEVGERQLGEEALENRKKVTAGLHERVKRYETILGEAMESLHAVVDSVEASLTMTMLASL